MVGSGDLPNQKMGAFSVSRVKLSELTQMENTGDMTGIQK